MRCTQRRSRVATGDRGISGFLVRECGPLGESHPVYAVDTIGDVGRSQQTEPVRDGAAMSEWLDAVLDGLRADRVHLVGLSYGGWIALNQACRSSDRLASVTVVDPRVRS